MKHVGPLLLAASALAAETPAAKPSSAAAKPAVEVRGHVGIEGQAFWREAQDPRQAEAVFSTLVQPELRLTWPSDGPRVVFTPFHRWDASDNTRSHFDIRELSFNQTWESLSVRAGVSKVFWGATEFAHVVDVINQTDLVEDIEGEEKLGQPMVALEKRTDYGKFEAFWLPYFRERTFPGPAGRPRVIPRILDNEALYESSREEWHQDFAVRWSKSFDTLDVGLSHFHGTTREPRYVPAVRGGEVVLVPLYEQVDQTGLDAQYVDGSWLWKAEAMLRKGQGPETFTRAAAGVEYTFYAVWGTSADLGLVAEYLYDSSGDNLINPYERDVGLGLRLAFNDQASTEMLAGVILDTRDGTAIGKIEASRRLGERWKLNLTARSFHNIPANDQPLGGLRRDDSLLVGLRYHF